MKKLCTLFLVFVAIAAYAQNDGNDYVKFDENGYLTEFRQTTKDGTVFQFWGGAESELKINFPDGTWANGIIKNNAKDLYNSIKNGTIDVVKEMNDMRGFRSVKEESRESFFWFDEVFVPRFELPYVSYDKGKTNLSNLVVKIVQNTLVHDNFYKQQKKFKFGQIIW